MRDMCIGQQPVVVADAGDAAAGGRATVDGDEFTHDIAVPDHQLGALALVFLVLRIAADRGVTDEVIVTSDAGRNRVLQWPYHATIANLHIGADDGDCTTRTPHQPRARIDEARDDQFVAAGHAQLRSSAPTLLPTRLRAVHAGNPFVRAPCS